MLEEIGAWDWEMGQQLRVPDVLAKDLSWFPAPRFSGSQEGPATPFWLPWELNACMHTHTHTQTCSIKINQIYVHTYIH